MARDAEDVFQRIADSDGFERKINKLKEVVHPRAIIQSMELSIIMYYLKC